MSDRVEMIQQQHRDHICGIFFSEGGSKRPPRMLKFFSGGKVGGPGGK